MPGNTIETREVDDMSVKLSKQKVSKVMRLYFQGLPQPVVAKEASVDQSTVSIYATRLRNRVGEVGLAAASKEVGVFDQVDALRSLSVELSQASMTADDAKKGLGILKSFMKLGVQPEEHTALIKTCHEIDDAGFVHAAVKLSKMEAQSNLTYEQVLSRFENAASKLPSTEKEVKERHRKIKALDDSIVQKEHRIASVETYISQLQNHAEVKKSELENKLAAQMKQLNVKGGELEQVAGLKRDLGQKGLDIPTLVKLAEEFPDQSMSMSGNRIKRALEQFGSLQEAASNLQTQKSALEEQTGMLKKEVAQLGNYKDRLVSETRALHEKLRQQDDQLHRQSERIRRRDYQYYLFESFVTMVEGSPSITKSIQDVIDLFQYMLDSGWYRVLKAHDLRTNFVLNVIGNYLNSFRCTNCGTAFILNRGPRADRYLMPHACPVCHICRVNADDAFLNAMVSEEQLDNIRRTEELQKEYEALKPFKAFLSLPCKYCDQPLSNWTDRLVLEIIGQLALAHAQCSNKASGR